ncbi:uncharacterized protein BXZ73DRAFT_98855 [Epithele typhae]|uniref:uncharacterized protein n=1 Tax=Epithele typhae TaxID=378194 RepID=UPI00200734C0|nr:uncharacterized protein BXZ73DRAFT_98855 [Epithele typhae]KAH9940419.1 hypothetical protein BXZ73DRAFT_98855 [Epithele typhae]
MSGERPVFGFWGLVGAVMVALKLKEHYDDHYETLPGAEEEGLSRGPIALRTPNVDEDAQDGASLLDTELPSRPRRKRRDCCMCCGMRCGLFWKAFGIVCLLLVGWQAVKFAIWMATPKPTGLEGMPQFGTSLGCDSAPHFYRDGKFEVRVPVGQNQGRGDHSMDFRNGFGTVVIAQGDEDLKDIKYEMTVRSDNQEYLDLIKLDVPTQQEIDSAEKESRLHLLMPSVRNACIRYDVTVYLPTSVKTFHVMSHSVTQVKFDPDSNFNFNSLAVTMYNRGEKNMVLPTEGIHATKSKLQMNEGYLVGDITLVNVVELVTQRGNATMNVRVHPAPSSAETPAPARLLTSSGAGRTDVRYVEHAAPHRPIDATHHVSMRGELYLTYEDSAFNGTVEVEATSFSAKRLQNAFKEDGGLPYVGSRDGADKMVVKTQGWAGLYF